MVRLQVHQFGVALGGVIGRPLDDLGQGGVAVDLGLALAEPAKVGAVQQQDPHAAIVRSARSSSASVTSSTSTTSPTAIGRIQRWRPPIRFLSEPSASRTPFVVERAVQREAELGEDLVDAICEVAFRATPGGDARDGTQTERNRFAVRHLVAALDLEGVADGVTKVQHPSLAVLVRVAVDDGQLQRGRRARSWRTPPLDPRRQSAARPTLFDQLPTAPDRRSARPSGTRPCRRADGQRAACRCRSASETISHAGQTAPTAFFAAGQVDGHLAADRGVGLRQPRRRDVDERHATAVQRGGQPADVAQRAAADHDERIAALGFDVAEPGEDRLEPAIVLAASPPSIAHRRSVWTASTRDGLAPGRARSARITGFAARERANRSSRKVRVFRPTPISSRPCSGPRRS